jgi:hypothetical protein
MDYVIACKFKNYRRHRIKKISLIKLRFFGVHRSFKTRLRLPPVGKQPHASANLAQTAALAAPSQSARQAGLGNMVLGNAIA